MNHTMTTDTLLNLIYHYIIAMVLIHHFKVYDFKISFCFQDLQLRTAIFSYQTFEIYKDCIKSQISKEKIFSLSKYETKF